MRDIFITLTKMATLILMTPSKIDQVCCFVRPFKKMNLLTNNSTDPSILALKLSFSSIHELTIYSRMVSFKNKSDLQLKIQNEGFQQYTHILDYSLNQTIKNCIPYHILFFCNNSFVRYRIEY